MLNARLDEAQAGIKIAGRNIKYLTYTDDTTLTAESEEELTATAKSLQSCLTLCDPIDGSPSGSPVPGILQARTLEWVAISLSNAWKWKVKVKSLSHVWLLATPWTAAYQAPPSFGFSRQEYWSGVPLPSPRRTKEPLNEGERGKWKSWLKTQNVENKVHDVWSHHFRANRVTMETVRNFILGGSKIIADGDCSHEIKRCLLLGRKAMINLFIGRTDVEAETPTLWPPDVKNWLIGKDPNAGQDWRQKEQGKTKDEMIGRHHQLDGHELEQALRVGDGQGSLSCCSPWGPKCQTRLSDWTELKLIFRVSVKCTWPSLGKTLGT